MDGPYSIADYRKPEVLLALTCIGLGAFALLDLIYIPAGVIGIIGVGGFNGGVRDQDLIELSVLLRGLSALGQALFFVFTPVVFCMLVYRCAKNARAIGFTNFNHSPGWCAGWFFVPFAHLWMPYKANGEVWQSSRTPIDESGDLQWWDAPTGAMFTCWWGVWVIGTIANNTASRMSRSQSFETTGMWLIPFAAILQILSAVLAIVVVIQLVKNQHRQATAVRAMLADDQSGNTAHV